MVKSSDEPSLSDRIRSSARKATAYASSNPVQAGDQRSVLPLTDFPTTYNADAPTGATPNEKRYALDGAGVAGAGRGMGVADNTLSALPPPAPPPLEEEHGETSSAIESQTKPHVGIRFYKVLKETLMSSWINVLLVFVPVGIAVQAAGIDPTIVFAMNAIAIIPLAGLLSHATESVASELGDTIGALMNVTFGNAVELIIFIIALVKNEIAIVQASLLGSILANLLLILGMCFLFGGLRFREQVYNSTVTQMSACLLSLSVTSLLLPTAFHASFTDNAIADSAVLRVSRGTSVILLLVYILYLLFQLKSHSYLYQSTPQHVIDEESHPGVLAEMLNSSSSSDSSSSSSSGDSDSSSDSHTTAKRIKRVLRGRRRRKSSASSKDTPSLPSTIGTPSASNFNNDSIDVMSVDSAGEHPTPARQPLGAILSGDEADTDGEHDKRSLRTRDTTINFRDFENEKGLTGSKSPEAKAKKKSKKKRHHHHHRKHGHDEKQPQPSGKGQTPSIPEDDMVQNRTSTPRVGFSQDAPNTADNSPKRPLTLRGITTRPMMSTMPRMLSSTVFSAANPTGLPYNGPQGLGITPRALHRSNSLPSRLNQTQFAPATAAAPAVPPHTSHPALDSGESGKPKTHMSRTAAIVMLLISTALVAVCAEFLVDSINYLVGHTSVSEAFIGLIILPIVGNAAEHVTAVTVASKNKMDLAIGVAVGSSIQIALFVTPVIVLLGWILQKDMSLYFSLFETVSLFVTAFVVNFLVLDGRSNYLEGALLIAAYVIIALAAFFYPDSDQQSQVGGAEETVKMLRFL